MTMNAQFPYPEANPLERLRIYDSLVMNADRWKLAHHYHGQRQSVVYQSLCQPGIIYGLGITVLEKPPEGSSKKFQDRDQQRQENRWIEIQPGIAIDHQGNPIVVDQNTDRSYRIVSDVFKEDTRTVYIVLRYVDPEQLQHASQNPTIQDRFRFIQSTDEPKFGEIELCRIKLVSNRVALEIPPDPFNPENNQIDVRYRIKAKFRPQATIQIGTLKAKWQPQISNALNALTNSLAALFPALRCEIDPDPVSSEELSRYDVLYVDPELINLQDSDLDKFADLDEYLRERGGVLLSVVPDQSSSPSGLRDWNNHDQFVRSQTFLFTQLPQSFGLWIAPQGERIVITQSLLNAWLGNHLTREEIRTAHELGINILHFIWQRRQLFQFLH
jgi:hypothetical protein